jgi:5-histidylcysteine sulfoxide synthase/putative 4-mercaptohistidine N1-methyltranferase
MNPVAQPPLPRTTARQAQGFATLAGPLSPTRTVLLTALGDAADPVAAKRAEIRRAFHATCELYERLFALIRDDASYYVRHEPLRHPLIFYLAHPAVFYVNKLTAGRLLPARIDARLEALMAVGVDEMSWDDLNAAHYDWPAVQTVRDYRAAMREAVDRFIGAMPLDLPIAWDSPAWVILMGIEHERIHLETSSVIMRMMPLEELRRGDELTPEEQRLWRACPVHGTPPPNDWLPVPAQTVRLGKRPDDHTYGWDNEYGVETVALPAFQAGRRLVTNHEYLAFVRAGGYRDEAWWTEEGRGWLRYTRAEHPRFWCRSGGDYRQRNLLEEIPLPLDWPVEVNCLEAQAYCAWLAAETGENVLLPTEAHWQALRALVPGDQPTWGGSDGSGRAPGNINLEHFASSCPVTMFPQIQGGPGPQDQGGPSPQAQGGPSPQAQGGPSPQGVGFTDIVGNVWQWTRSPIMPLEGFEVHPLYDDFSVPTFDGRHNLIKGGSWISTGNEALASARYAFRRHFFQHAGFRTVIEERGHEAATAGSRLYETDQLVTQYLEFHYGPAALGVPNFPRACVEATMPLVPGDRRRRCLDIGCSVGRSAFEFARHFGHVDAIDFSARFIQAGVRLQEGGDVHYEVPTEGELTLPRATSLARLGLAEVGGRVAFQQGDACNLKPLLTGYDLVFAGNLLDRLYDPALFLAEIARRIEPGGLLVLTSPYTWLEEYTPREKWLGGRREAGEPLTSFDGLVRALGGGFALIHRQDLPFVIRETARKHQHSVADMTVWRLADAPSATMSGVS